MFGFERFWWHLTTWTTQHTQPEAVMFNAHVDFKACCLALPSIADAELDEDTEAAAAQNKQVSNLFYHKVTSFDRTKQASGRHKSLQ